MTVASEPVWPAKRLRFLMQRGLSPDKQRTLASATRAAFLPMEAIGHQGTLDCSIVREIGDIRDGFTQFFDGDILVAKITPCFENGKGALVQGTPEGIGFGTTELHVLRPTGEIDGRFLYYVTASDRFRKLGEAAMAGAAGQKRVPEDFVRDYRIVLPAIATQRAIVDHLDLETARLDRLVAEKERILRLLGEKRQALISRAVTRGLEPGVPTRDSGIPWLGEVPAHWAVERARWLFKEHDERTRTGDEELLTVSHLTGVTPRSEKDVNMFMAATMEGYKIVAAGDLVINTLWAWMGAMGISPLDGIVSPAYNVYRPTDALEAGYVDALVRSPLFAQEVTRHSKGVWSSRLRLYPEEFFDVVFPVPSRAEQSRIVRLVETEVRKLDDLQVAAENAVALIEERRAALIAAAVSGQIEVGSGA